MAVLLIWGIASGSFLQSEEMPGATSSLCSVGLVGAGGWIAGYKAEALFEEGRKKIQYGGEEVFLAVK